MAKETHQPCYPLSQQQPLKLQRYSLRQDLEEFGYQQPDYGLFFKAKDLHSCDRAFLPLIVKPNSQFSRMPSVFCESAHTAAQAVEDILHDKEALGALWEEFIVGEEILVQTFGWQNKAHVIAVMERHRDPRNPLHPLGYDLPYQNPQLATQAAEMASGLLIKLRLQVGLTQIKFINKNGVLYLIDLRTDYLSPYAEHLIQESYGINLKANQAAFEEGKFEQINLEKTTDLVSVLRFEEKLQEKKNLKKLPEKPIKTFFMTCDRSYVGAIDKLHLT